MAGFSVHAELLHNITREVSRRVTEKAKEASDKTAERIRQRAAANTHRRSGEAASSYTITHDGDKAVVGNTAPYFHFIELGSHEMPAQHPLQHAAQQDEHEHEKTVTASLKEVL